LPILLIPALRFAYHVLLKKEYCNILSGSMVGNLLLFG